MLSCLSFLCFPAPKILLLFLFPLSLLHPWNFMCFFGVFTPIKEEFLEKKKKKDNLAPVSNPSLHCFPGTFLALSFQGTTPQLSFSHHIDHSVFLVKFPCSLYFLFSLDSSSSCPMNFNNSYRTVIIKFTSLALISPKSL